MLRALSGMILTACQTVRMASVAHRKHLPQHSCRMYLGCKQEELRQSSQEPGAELAAASEALAAAQAERDRAKAQLTRWGGL